jgi:raffinose/stachyose/melibiose transport system substrate-binding protein
VAGPRMPRLRPALSLAAVTTLVVGISACGGGSGTSAGDGSFGLLINDDNAIVQDALKTLSTEACQGENAAAPLKIDAVPQSGLDQRLQLLGGQGALPAQFAASGSPAVTKDLDRAGQTLDLRQTLTDLGVYDDLEPAAVSTIEKLYGRVVVLPYQFNIEGVWYNKKLFADNGIAIPTTWIEMVRAAAKLKSAGVTPFSASGAEGWPITRLIGGYLYRSLGPDALEKVADGEAKLTDPEYVEAAQAVADLGEAGDFGKGVGSISYDTAVAQFLTGKAGMFYMGSWALGSFNDVGQDKIGADSIGFFPLPAVTGGAGSADQIPANVGLPIAVSAKKYNDKVGAWLSCIAKNYGATALTTQGTVSGFKVQGDIADIPALTRTVQDTISTAKETLLWFEALFGAKATAASQQNAAPLVTGQLSPVDFMSKVQADLDAE